MFKVYSIQSIYTGLFFIQDLKLGHYMKIPHRVTFSGRLKNRATDAIVP